MRLTQDVRLLKICDFCNKALIENNPKTKYDTPQYKNKANIYKIDTDLFLKILYNLKRVFLLKFLARICQMI